ncbi:MAG: DUF2007 domain-containing protein [Rikenellaceae bacterium]
MQVDTMVVLKEYDILSNAEMAKALLDDAGMWCMVNNEYMSTIYPTGIAPAQLITRQEDAPRALEIISALIFEEDEFEEEVVVEA